jgi:fumarylacetoacetate (FAA) hydrolase
MKLATLRSAGRDGTLIVVSRDGARYLTAGGIAATMQAALDDWDVTEPQLQALSARLQDGEGSPLDPAALHSPLPRAYEWIDGSAYINHVILVRRARNAEPPATLRTDPLVYQGGSGVFLAPTDDIPLADGSWGLDFESEVVVILGDTPQGVSAEEAGAHIRLVTICNDITLRSLIPTELKKGFGFFNGKPATAFAPFAVTPDELGDVWRDGRLHLTMRTLLNDTLVGNVEAGPEMHFSFHDLIAHVTRTRALTAGTLLGSGTVSNEDTSHGSSCLSEKRMLEMIDHSSAETPYMQPGDRVEISMAGADGADLFGTIRQSVVTGSQPAPGKGL